MPEAVPPEVFFTSLGVGLVIGVLAVWLLPRHRYLPRATTTSPRYQDVNHPDSPWLRSTVASARALYLLAAPIAGVCAGLLLARYLSGSVSPAAVHGLSALSAALAGAVAVAITYGLYGLYFRFPILERVALGFLFLTLAWRLIAQFIAG